MDGKYMRNYSHSAGFYRQGQKIESREFGEEDKLRLIKLEATHIVHLNQVLRHAKVIGIGVKPLADSCVQIK